MRNSQRTNTVYYWLLIVTIGLLIFGSVMIFSASSVMAFSVEGDSYYYLKRQLAWTLFGLGTLGILCRIHYQKLRKLAGWGIFLSLVLLVLVLVPGVGKSAGGASRWMQIGPFSFQPSEFAKIAVILFVADSLERRKKDLNDLSRLTAPFVSVLAIIGLILVQPHLGTSFLIAVTVLAMIFLAGAPILHVSALAVAGSAVSLLAVLCTSYRRQRFLAFLNPWADPRNAGFHIIQSLFAFGSGGLTGLGLGMSHQKFFYLPAAHTDFIFAIIGEELGLLGTLSLVSAFVLFAYLGMKISFLCKDSFGRLLGSGITFMILIQTVINMGAVTGILPITGVPMPLISFGGSALVFTLGGIGILLNIAVSGNRIEKKSRPRERNESDHKRGRDSGPPVSGIGVSRNFKVYRGSG